MTRYIPIAALLALAACGNSVPALEVALTAAETSAIQYVTLPACAPGATSQTGGKLCSQATVVVQIKQADSVAYAAVKAAENGTGTVAAANAAIAGLTKLVPILATSN